MRIEQIDPVSDEAALRTCHELIVSGQSEDDPNVPALSFGMFRGHWAYGFAGDPRQVWLATSDAGVPVGCYLLELPEQENRANAFGYPVVGRAARRRGAGTALLSHLAGQAERAGRSLLVSGCRTGSPGDAFARAVGARPDLQDARRVLDLGPELAPRLRELRAEAEPRAAAYTLRRWTGPAPEDLVDGVAAVASAMEDAPHESGVEPLVWDAERVRKADECAALQGVRWYSIAAIHTATSEMAALTQAGVDPDVDEWGFQEITAVTRPHRGHRLGLLVKIAMLEWLAAAEPQLHRMVTYNAVQNDHMIGVNSQLGNRVSDYFQNFEMDVAAARKLMPGG